MSLSELSLSMVWRALKIFRRILYYIIIITIICWYFLFCGAEQSAKKIGFAAFALSELGKHDNFLKLVYIRIILQIWNLQE